MKVQRVCLDDYYYYHKHTTAEPSESAELFIFMRLPFAARGRSWQMVSSQSINVSKLMVVNQVEITGAQNTKSRFAFGVHYSVFTQGECAVVHRTDTDQSHTFQYQCCAIYFARLNSYFHSIWFSIFLRFAIWCIVNDARSSFVSAYLRMGHTVSSMQSVRIIGAK